MQAEEILRLAKTEEVPEDWHVYPLQKNKVIIGLIGWAFGTIIGFGLFALVYQLVVPSNFQRGIILILFTLLLFAIFLFIGLGSLWTFITDAIRLKEHDKHLIVITPESFVQQKGSKIIHVPTQHIRYVTVRGLRKPPRKVTEDDITSVRQMPNMGDTIVTLIFGRAWTKEGRKWRRKRMRTPLTLAFLDDRTNKTHVVLQDETYGDPAEIGEALNKYAPKEDEEEKREEAEEIKAEK
ncbi:hypothetical protein EI42_05331 [Thermosporothrix hazakensis]|jgi:hypothetical protein|uniref:Uncharacterized protein n=1 Tax=Thermosporothrix hazakensis TaxID=644383 RepID=A0A326UBW1_THEHA|nr:hypothetical protein [Thermosporothrix hazakensis]PZW22546.1 hypothetical protein EI42_05331 [Thermosporothrix hazakensis]GCE48518.1 hypothetical protein KTH_33870 [Thermosporothrix hazakensis]